MEQLGAAPRMMLEVGTYIGSGAINAWVPLVQRYTGDAPGILLCTDTWQGTLHMRLDLRSETSNHLVRMRRAFPDIGETFLRRVVSKNLTNTIFPIAMPSLLAARYLYFLGYKLDVIYVDSAHEVGETLVELHMYYLLLRPGGLLIGDDYGFAAVSHDVNLFAKCHHVSLNLIKHPLNAKWGDSQWWIKKPMEA